MQSAREKQADSGLFDLLPQGELNQASSKRTYKQDLNEILNGYLLKTYYKTASLMAFSAQGVAILFDRQFHE